MESGRGRADELTAASPRSASPERRWWVRMRAVLATGLVLAAGATPTMAAWTDHAVADGEFSASTFVVEANTSDPLDPDGWAPHADDPAVLQLSADDLIPGSRTHGALALRTSEGSVGGTAEIHGSDSDSDLVRALRYRAVVSPTCHDGAFAAGADFLVGDEHTAVPLTSGQNPDAALELPAAEPSAPGEPVLVCVEMSLADDADNALQGESASMQWHITSTSISKSS